MAKDIEGNIINIGDTVYYARKRDYTANGELLKLEVTQITPNGNVKMGKYTSTESDTQILKAKYYESNF